MSDTASNGSRSDLKFNSRVHAESRTRGTEGYELIQWNVSLIPVFELPVSQCYLGW
ncbi:hypothetical protein BgiBS90_010051, partial [Biomphalaria glabrata]